MIATIESRIERLRQDCIETDEKIDEGSVASFLNFVEALGIKVKPAMSLDPENTLYAVWELDREYIFRFFGDGKIHFLLMKRKDDNET